MGKSKVSPARVIALEREKRALELRRMGYRYDQIAEALGISQNTAWNAVQRAFKRACCLVDEEARVQRELDLQRLDAALAAIWPKVRQGNTAAVDRLVRLLERRSRLLGLDAPTEVRNEMIVRQYVGINVDET
jgi:predicted DNA-binding protein (UPF0251 family)